MAVLGLLHVEWYPIHYAQMPEKLLLSGTKIGLDRSPSHTGSVRPEFGVCQKVVRKGGRGHRC